MWYIIVTEAKTIFKMRGLNEMKSHQIKTAKTGYIVISIILCIFGIVLIAVPKFSIKALGIISGVILVLFGLVKLVGYFSKDLYRLAFQYDLALGGLLILLGAIILMNPSSLMNFICIALGIYILSDGLFKVQIAIDSKCFGIKKWWAILICAIISAILGFVLMFRPNEGSSVITVLMGVALLFEGILNLLTVITAVKISKNTPSDVVEIEFSDDL